MNTTSTFRTCLWVLAIIGFALAIAGCATVPESVKEANSQRLSQVKDITGDLTAARNAQPQVRADVWLPPGSYNIGGEGFHIARIEVREDLSLIGITALNQTDWQISENVAISALRVVTPLLGFLGGAYFNNESLKTLAGAMTTTSQTAINSAADHTAAGANAAAAGIALQPQP